MAKALTIYRRESTDWMRRARCDTEECAVSQFPECITWFHFCR